jgi:proline-specific peptidase
MAASEGGRSEEPMKTGRVKTSEGYELYYEVAGDAAETLLCLHGGPGADCGYVRPLSALAGDNLQVVIYDQLGSGKSDVPPADYDWTVARFVEELDDLRQRLELGRVHLMGNSWGGILALQYALDRPHGVASLVLSDTAASLPAALAEIDGLRAALEPATRATLERYEAAEDYENSEYLAAVDELYIRHLWRPYPWEHDRALREWHDKIVPIFAADGPAFAAMWGPNDFYCTGTLADWDVTARLPEIAAPTLIVCGSYDMAPPALHRAMADRIPDNEYVIFGNSSHLPWLENEASAYLAVLRDFIRRHPVGAATQGES